jgi:asparagine N-glycosylation enzyme membrane subunit Stt3
MAGSRPQPEQYATRGEWRWALKLWKKRHGGSLLATLAIAVFFGAWSGSQAALFALVAFAIVAHVIARSRP